MKAKLTITVDEDLIPIAKKHARARGVSLSQLIEASLVGLTAGDGRSFSEKWRGQFREANRDDELYRGLAEKHL